MKKIIYDTDVGNDDVMTLIYLLFHTNIQLAAITVASTGGINGQKRAQNIADLCAMLKNPNIPIAYGTTEHCGVCVEPFPGYFLQMMDNVLHERNILPHPEAVIPDVPTAVELLKATLETSNEPVTILATGPLTNIGQLLQAHPNLRHKIEKIVIMGGAVRVPGNIPPLHNQSTNTEAEWNIIIDPKAAEIVFQSGVPVVLVPLDATNQIPMTEQFYHFFSQQQHHPELKLIYELQKLIVDGFGMELFLKEFYLWDPLAAMVCLYPEIAINESLPIIVNLETGKTQLVEDHIEGSAIINVTTKFHKPEEILTMFVGHIREYLLANRATVSAMSMYQPSPTAATLKAEIDIEENDHTVVMGHRG